MRVRRTSNLDVPSMPRSFEALAFLSPDMDNVRNVERARFAAEFDDVEQAASVAISELRQVGCEAQPSYLIGVTFWLRCIESCQGAVLLAERGMATSSCALLRTAWECLFAACAVWRQSACIDQLDRSHQNERVKQAKAMLEAGAETKVSPAELTELKKIAAETRLDHGWSHQRAAEIAGLDFEYAMIWRGLGMAGAHATPRSLDDYHVELADGTFDLQLQPNFDRLVWLLSLAKTCLVIGIARRQEVWTELGT